MKVPLFFILILTELIPLVAKSYVMSWLLRQIRIENRIIQIQSRCLTLSNKMTRSGYLSADSPDPLITGEMDMIADAFGGRIVLVDKNFEITGNTFKLIVRRINMSEEVIRCFQRGDSSRHHKDKYYIVLATPACDGTPEKNIEGVLVVTGSTEDLLVPVEKTSKKTTFFRVVIPQVLIMLIFGLITLLMRLFKRPQTGPNRVAQGDPNEPTTEHTYKETREISLVVATTLTRLETVDQSGEEFMSDVSHELRTPITSIRVLADSLMGMEEIPAGLYRESMMDISDEIDRRSKIVNNLLSLVKMDKTITEINITQIDISALLQLISKRLRSVTKKRDVELIFKNIQEVVAGVDEVKPSLAPDNLAENTIKYSIEDGWVRVVSNTNHKFFYMKVADSGCSTPEEFQGNVFERFYRVDKARFRGTGGTGLRLTITRKVVLMHEGTIKVISREDESLTFTVRVPLIYIP